MYKNIIITLTILFSMSHANHIFSESERIRGYKISNDTIFFVFDEETYDVRPDRVVVAGAFRNWDDDMAPSAWNLKKSNIHERLWVLRTTRPISLGTEFKYRINDGQWLDPPANAANRYNGNLTLGDIDQIKSMEAEIMGPRYIHAEFRGENITISYDPADYRLYDSRGIEIRINNIFYIRPGQIQIYPDQDLDITKVYYLKDENAAVQSVCRFDGWFRSTYSEKELGAFYNKRSGKTWFRIFAPRASAVKLYLYRSPGEKHYQQKNLKMDSYGVWEITLPGDKNGIYYDYTIHGPEDPGNHFFETNPVHVSDPYGQVSVDSFGPCRVWRRVNPPRPLQTGRPAMQDVIAYEVHVQDFTSELPVATNKKGTFTGFIQRGLTNSLGQKIGFDHLVELGINVVHLQPVQEFMHYPDKEWREHFQNDSYMTEQGINEENYQWGYRTSHALAIESRFREKGSDWGAQNAQFRDLVQAFHDEGIAVIVDVVFNHTAERMDGRMDYFNFSVLDKQYYYRTDRDLEFIGEYGTETKSEERPMVQRWIIDQCKNLIDQYGIDGFRIDLAGQTDEQTLRALKQQLGPDIIIYGEPWIASADPDYENNPDWDWYKADAPITFFQDNARDAFKGSPFKLEDKWRDRGYAGGNGGREEVKKALSAGFEFDDTPIDGINYLDIHDNWALADRFAIDNWDGRFGVHESRVKIAATLLFTSLGPVVIHGGTEFLRSKGHAPLEELKKRFQNSYLHFHGKRDTYNLAKANVFVWENKGKSISGNDQEVKNNYDNMYRFWCGLIALRNSTAGKVFRIADKPADNYYQWIEPENLKLLGYNVNDQILVLINTDSVSGDFKDILLPESTTWQMVADIEKVDLENGIMDYSFSSLAGGKNYSINLAPESIYIWIKK